MKVNITGVGLIPKVGLLAPVYGRDLSKDTVSVILKYSSFKVYVAATGIRITKKNIDEIFGTAVKQSTNPSNATTKKASKKVEAPVEIEQVAEPVVFDTVVEAADIEEPIEAVEAVEVDEVDEVASEDITTLEEDADDTTETTEEAIVEQPKYNKKKKRH